jgi:hypothetical protein
MHATNSIEISRVYRPLNTLRRQLPWVIAEQGLAPDQRIFRNDAGDAQISPLHHACVPCHPMSFICSFKFSDRGFLLEATRGRPFSFSPVPSFLPDFDSHAWPQKARKGEKSRPRVAGRPRVASLGHVWPRVVGRPCVAVTFSISLLLDATCGRA